MSSAQYITAKAHVVTNSDAAEKLASKILQIFKRPDWDDGEQEVAVENGEGFVETEVKASGFAIGKPLSAVDEALKEVASLSNGSYGLMIVESDFGVESFDCYGSVELAETESIDEGVVWASEDFLNLFVSMKAEEWQRALGCNLGSLADEIESQGEDLLPMLLPSAFLQACDNDGEVVFQYQDIEPFNPEGEAYGESEDVAVMFELDGHDLKHETFKELIDALNCVPSELPQPDAKILLRLFNASEAGDSFESRMIDTDTPAMLVFKSSWGKVEDVKVLVPTSDK